MILSCDLHIHSALSPCAENDMTPGNIVMMSMLNALDAISLTDHGSCRNVRAASEISDQLRSEGQNSPRVIPGMEMECAEGFHLLAYFPDVDTAEAFEAFYEKHRIILPNKPDIFGQQLIFDSVDHVIGEYDQLLSVSSYLSSEELVDAVLRFDGVVVPAHIDRDSYSMLSSLGAIPPEFNGKILEISSRTNAVQMLKKHPELYRFVFVSNSDAHNLTMIADPGFGYEFPSHFRNGFSAKDFVLSLREQSYQ